MMWLYKMSSKRSVKNLTIAALTFSPKPIQLPQLGCPLEGGRGKFSFRILWQASSMNASYQSSNNISFFIHLIAIIKHIYFLIHFIIPLFITVEIGSQESGCVSCICWSQLILYCQQRYNINIFEKTLSLRKAYISNV